MSVIIRLQNLPLSAKSGDIRRFFGGLRIPNGGVHIIGGEKGDAFIAFTSDEDARLAMRKDGGKILDSRVKLYLSSRMEMQHEIGRVTVKDHDSTRQRSPSVRQRSSRSPIDERKIDYDRSYRSNSTGRGRRDYSPRSRRSPGRRSRSPRRSMTPRRRSKSPRRWSRSPSGSLRSRSPIERTAMSPKDRNSPYKVDENLLKLQKIFGIGHTSEEDSWKSKEFRREEQALLEQKIAEALTVSLTSMGKMTDLYHNSRPVEPAVNMQQLGRSSQPFVKMEPHMMPFKPEYNPGHAEMPIQDNRIFMPNILPVSNMNMQGNFPPSVAPFQHPVSIPPPARMPLPMANIPPPMPMANLPPPLPIQNLPPPMQNMPFVPIPPSNMTPSVPNNLGNSNIPLRGFFVTVSGMDPSWSVGDIQTMLRGIFVPQKNIKWEVNDIGSKTGTAFIRLYQRDDFIELLKHATYTYNNRLITVTECHMFRRYFTNEIPTEGSLNSPSGNFYYKMAGLPYEATYELVLDFFAGLEVTDLYIMYSKATNGFRIEGKATGLAFIAFGNAGDHQKAMEKNLKFFGNTRRVIKLANCTKKNMMEAKKNNNDLLSQSQLFVPSDIAANVARPDVDSFEKPPFCALLTGLPQNVTKTKIIKFFELAKVNPSYIHIMVNEQKKPNGRAFAEFGYFQDVDAACQCHGKKIDGKIINVEQTSYEEMMKSLDSQKTNFSQQQAKKNQNQVMPFPVHENFRPDPEYNSPRNNFQVFEYANESSEPLPIPDTSELEILYDSTQSTATGFKDRKPSRREDSYRKQNSRPSNLSFPDRVPAFNTAQQGRGSKKNTDKEELRKKLELEEAARTPVKFEVKIKPAISKSAKIEDAFDSSSKVDPKRKLSKLSPERPPAVPPKPPATKNDKNLKGKSIEEAPKPKSRSPSRDYRKNDKAAPSDARSSSSKSETRDSKNYKPRNRSRDGSNGRKINEIKRRSPPRSNARRSPFRGRASRSPFKPHYSRPDPYAYDDRTYAPYEETVVQIINVDPIIGSAELLNFFFEFEIDPDKIIRRISERGEPTGDVRVTFQSRRDAERAVRTFKGSSINGLPVDLFLVS